MQHATNRRKVFILEGNIGAGKSTLLDIIAQNLPEVEVVFEPTKQWQQTGLDDNLLELFYKDTKRWAYTFQTYAFITRIKAQLDSLLAAPHKPIQLLERSIYCDRYCFAKNCYEAGTMSKLEWHIYTEWFSWLSHSYAMQPDGFIYVQVDPKICYERISKRKRCEESDIPLSYLETLHQKHQDWLVNKIDVDPAIQNKPVLTLNCNEEFESNTAKKEEILRSVSEFVHSFSKTPNYTQYYTDPQQAKSHNPTL